MEDTITIMNFSDVYKQEYFYNDAKYRFLDCTDIVGTNCYCDNEALKDIRKRIDRYCAEGIHFIDSGNYHYISKLWTDKLREPFILVVFDHHPDMQPSLFDAFMSCGCWVRSVLDTNPYVQKVVIMGASKELLNKVDSKYQGKVVGYSDTLLSNEENWRIFSDLHINIPVYISVDKDVLSRESVITNWDQGVLSLAQLKELLLLILKTNKVLGIDICGECQYMLDYMNGNNSYEAIRQNDQVNRELLHLLCSKFGLDMRKVK